MTIRHTTVTGVTVTIDVRPSVLEERDVSLTIDLGHDDRVSLQLTAAEAEQLRGELRAAIRQAR